jgi:ABC-type amino acid transport substrate-binding protein
MMRLSDGLIDLVRMWEKPAAPFDEGWEVPKDQVDDAVAYAFAHFKVVAFYSDVKEWEDMIMRWDDLYGEKLGVKASTNSAIAWDMRTKQMQLTKAIEGLNRTVVEQVAKHSNNPKLNSHFYNARQRENKWGVGFSKESRSSSKKVDGVAATTLAFMARADYKAKGKPEKKRYGIAW